MRIDRRKPPVLPAHVELIGRRADARLQRVEALVAPRFATATIDRNREIAVYADAQSELQCACAGGLQLAIGLPLQVLEELHPIEMLPLERQHCFTARIAIARRPSRPAPD